MLHLPLSPRNNIRIRQQFDWSYMLGQQKSAQHFAYNDWHEDFN